MNKQSFGMALRKVIFEALAEIQDFKFAPPNLGLQICGASSKGKFVIFRCADLVQL